MKEVKVGLVAGRHELPVSQYIFESVDDSEINAFDKLESGVLSFMQQRRLLEREGDKLKAVKGKNLTVYITGLTSATSSVLKVCAEYGIPLTLMHFNKSDGEYKPQRIFAGS